jgi:energy-coupling factor transport system permease protein
MYLRAKQAYGKYVAADSGLHRLDPASKIVASCVVTVTIFLCMRWVHLGLVAGYILVLCLLSKVSLRFYAESLKYFIWMFALSFVINVVFPRGGTAMALSYGAVNIAGIFSVRLALMILTATMLTVTTTPSDVGEALMAMSSIRGRVGRRAAEFAALLAISLRFVPVMVEEAERIRAAQQLRGQSASGLRQRIRFVIGLTVPLMESSLRRATNLGFALEARCYGYRVPKSSGVRIGRPEVALGTSAFLLLAGIIVTR